MGAAVRFLISAAIAAAIAAWMFRDSDLATRIGACLSLGVGVGALVALVFGHRPNPLKGRGESHRGG